MFTPLYRVLLVLVIASSNAVAAGDNPFAKNDRINIGTDISWKIDHKAVVATKSINDSKGTHYHLDYDNKRIRLALSSDKNNVEPKTFSQLEITDVKLDGKQILLFKWCLNNQPRHNRFLQQGLSVKNDVCIINSDGSSFVMHLNQDTLKMLQQAKRLSIVLKPFRSQIELNYDFSDFADMTLALNTKVEKPAVALSKKCWAGPPEGYQTIKSVEYDCADASAKLEAQAWVTKLVLEEDAKQLQVSKAEELSKSKLVEEKRASELAKEKQRKLAEANKKKKLAEKLKRDKLLQAETAAIAASEAKQLKLNDEITVKMLNVCGKYWDKGEHRCYCQKYIDHAPSAIRANSSCK